MKGKEKDFDCLKFAREARARANRECAGMTVEERMEWLANLDFSDDPILHELSQRGHRQAEQREREQRQRELERTSAGR